MKNYEIYSIMRKIALFTALDEQECYEIISTGQWRQYYRDETLPMHSLDKAFYIILSGELAFIKNTPKNQEVTEIMRCAAGECFSTYGSRASHIRIIEDAEVLFFKRRTFNNIVIPFLRTVDFFRELSDKELSAIARAVILEHYDEGEILFNQGAVANALYIVISGKVTMIKKDSEDGASIDEVLTTYTRGKSFGERGVLSDQPRAASARIEERTSLLILPREKFQTLTEKYVRIAFGLYRNLAHQLEEESTKSRRETREIEKVTELIQSAKMAALGHLVAGLAHEINTPVGIISTDSYQLKRNWARTREYYEDIPQVIREFSEKDHLQVVADELGFALDDQTRQLVREYTVRQCDYINDYYQQPRLARFINNIHAISDELGKASELIKGIIKSLANFARLDEAELKTVDVLEGLDSTIALLHHELKYKVIVQKEYEHLPKITCCPNQLNQVFMNILMNAIQALELDKLPSGEKGLIQIRTYQERGWAVVAITDNGKGIPHEHLAKIFDPFFSTKRAAAAAGGLGLGLGLPISKKIVEEKHLGRIDVESIPHERTTFFIKLPLDRSIITTLGNN